MIARAVLVTLAFAAVCTAAAFSGIAIFYVFYAYVNVAGAAALTSLTVLLLLGAGSAIYFAWTRKQTIAQPQPLAAPAAQDSLVVALTQLAKEHPLIAVGFAAALGLSDTMNKSGDRSRRVH